MGKDQIFIWVAVCFAAALLLVLLKFLRARGKAAPVDDGESPPALIEGTAVFTGRHKGVKYWLYYDNERARLEIEMGEGVASPFIYDRKADKPELPGDARDLEVKELLELRAVYVEAAATGALVAALFPERVLNGNAGRPGGPSPEEAVANKVVELLSAIRDKSRKRPDKPG
ncbi:MAG: hypothetical protein PHV36_03470 [Elusimicrobiales bacterium]|nr:hypothetical protein [Elusimicrobiales bacterium]